MCNVFLILSIFLSFSLSIASPKPTVAVNHELRVSANSLRKSYSIKDVAALAKTLGVETTNLFEANATKTDKEKQEQEKVEKRTQSSVRNRTPKISPFQHGTKWEKGWKWEKTLGIGLATGHTAYKTGRAALKKEKQEARISKESDLVILAQAKSGEMPSPSSQGSLLYVTSSSAVVSVGTSPRTQNYMAQVSAQKKTNNKPNHPSGSWNCCWSSNGE